MFKAKIKASEARAPFNTYDSLLEVPSGLVSTQNAWLTLTLRVNLNFVDSKQAPKGAGNADKRVRGRDGKWYAKDWDGWLFPMLDWPASFKEHFQKKFQEHAEKVWNFQFLLLTPTNYAELDFTDFGGAGWKVRPNVLCLFRLEFALSNVHRTINVYNLNLRTAHVANINKRANPTGKDVSDFDAGTFRSDAENYDDRDLFRPYVYNAAKKVMHDTIGHEIGHALGQDHILPLKKRAGNYVNDPHPYHTGTNRIAPATGDLRCETPKLGTAAPDCYGKTEEDQFNIMGGGDRIYLVNAISWRERIALHTKTKPSDWGVTGLTSIPPRKITLKTSMMSPKQDF